MSTINYRPLHDLVWTTKPRASRLRFEDTPIGGTVLAHGSAANVREMIFRSHAVRNLDWEWQLTPRPDIAPRAWLCTRIG